MGPMRLETATPFLIFFPPPHNPSSRVARNSTNVCAMRHGPHAARNCDPHPYLSSTAPHSIFVSPCCLPLSRLSFFPSPTTKYGKERPNRSPCDALVDVSNHTASLSGGHGWIRAVQGRRRYESETRGFLCVRGHCDHLNPTTMC